MATRLLTAADGRVAGAIAVNTRTAEFLVLKAKAVILCMGAAGRLGLPTSGYMFGTYENAANSGDGYAMAYHAGAALANLECFQINPLIKDYNGPACAYVAGPFGAYTANNEGSRFIECDYWSGQMMLEFYNELQSGKGPVFLKLNHLHENTISEIETYAAQGRAADARPVPRGPQHRLSQGDDRDAYLRDRLLLRPLARRACSSTSSRARPCRAFMPPATWRACRTTTCWAPSPTARSPARTPWTYAEDVDFAEFDAADIAREKERVLAPTRREDGIPPNQIEYKARRLVNDYLQPPKVTRKFELGQKRLDEVRDDMEQHDDGAQCA